MGNNSNKSQYEGKKSVNIKKNPLLTEKIKLDYQEVNIDDQKKVQSAQQSPSAWSKPASNSHAYSDISQLNSEVTEYSSAVDE